MVIEVVNLAENPPKKLKIVINLMLNRYFSPLRTLSTVPKDGNLLLSNC